MATNPTVLVLRMYDSLGDPLSLDLYDGDTDPMELLDIYTGLKETMGHTVTSSLDSEWLGFSDGTKLTLTMQEVHKL